MASRIDYKPGYYWKLAVIRCSHARSLFTGCHCRADAQRDASNDADWRWVPAWGCEGVHDLSTAQIVVAYGARPRSRMVGRATPSQPVFRIAVVSLSHRMFDVRHMVKLKTCGTHDASEQKHGDERPNHHAAESLTCLMN